MYNLPINNKYDNYTFSQLNQSINSIIEQNDIELATIMAQMGKINIMLFLNEPINTWYRYKYSPLLGTPFYSFSQSIKNKIYKIFIEELTLKGYVSLRCLELLNENFDLQYEIYGATNWSGNYNDEPRFLLNIANAPYEIRFEDINVYFKLITSKKYQNILKKYLPIFVDEYNKTHNQSNIFEYKDIDQLCTYIDLKNDKQVINYIYNYPDFYRYLAINSPKKHYKFWIEFFLSYRCSIMAKRNQNMINQIIQKMIETNYLNDEELFNIIINKKSISHISIYFSNTLKSKLREDLNLSIICYANCCNKHKKELKKMLGIKVTNSDRFKYMFGANK
jgi:hypothetical protein